MAHNSVGSCYYHKETAVVAACRKCGRFLCRDCFDRGNGICRDCKVKIVINRSNENERNAAKLFPNNDTKEIERRNMIIAVQQNQKKKAK